MLIRPQGKPCIVPDGATDLKIGPDHWFMSTGRTTVEVPSGELLLRVERGLEFVRIKQRITVDGPTSKNVTLRRWVDMRKRGYQCGENHLHLDSVSLAPMVGRPFLCNTLNRCLPGWSR